MVFPDIIVNTPEKIVFLIDNIVVALGFLAILLAVMIDFSEFHKKQGVKREKRSIVETGTMFLFFFLFYILIRFNIGAVHISFSPIFVIVNGIFLALFIIGCLVNIAGRLSLGKNWSNQIKIYNDHTFVSGGIYSLVRHPLYASIIWMFISSSIIYLNYFALLSALLIFIPFMYYRAKQEEVLLASEFKNYKKYQIGVGMFFPKIKWHKK
jgi:protein-S-isoprenylcysteine O-methyltransferase Ste14